MTVGPPNRAVYTALLGGYERLQEQPAAEGSSIPFICLTDDPALTSDTWEVRLVRPAFERDSVRSARAAKIVGDPALGEFDETLWIDNKVLLTADPGVVLDKLLSDADVAVIHHSYRKSLVAEFDEVARVGLDEPARIYEQLIHYAETKPHLLDQQPYWSAILARRWTPSVRAAMQTWMNHVLRYSRRDQLSMPYALDGVPGVRALDLDNHGSDWHTWTTDHVSLQVDASTRSNAFRTSIRAPLAGAAALNADLETAHAELAAERERADAARAEAAELLAKVGVLRVRVRSLKGKLTAERERSAVLREQLARRPVRRALGRLRQGLRRT